MLSNRIPAPEGREAGQDTLVVSIINYRTARMTIDCVASVLDDIAATPDVAAHVVVVDNASGDGSAEEIAAWIDARPGRPVTLVRSERNGGFSAGHNLGIGARRARYYLLLNSDALLRPGFCRAILKAAEAAGGAGLIAPQLEDPDGTAQISCFRLHSPASEIIRGAATGPVTRMLRRWEVPLESPPPPADIEWASFACILLRGAMVETIGPMDERYFLYFEDSEYCMRARRAGWNLVHAPDARAVHLRGGSGPVKALAKKRSRLPRYFYESRARFFRQRYGILGPLAANLGWHAGRAVSALRRQAHASVEGEATDIWIGAWKPSR